MGRKRRSVQGGKPMQVKNSGYSEGAASHSSNIMKAWHPTKLSSKTDIDANLNTLRARSADQAINTPIGAAAISTSAMHTVGAELRVAPRIRYKILGLSDSEAREWERRTAIMRGNHSAERASWLIEIYWHVCYTVSKKTGATGRRLASFRRL